MRWALRKTSMEDWLVSAIMAMYDGAELWMEIATVFK